MNPMPPSGEQIRRVRRSHPYAPDLSWVPGAAEAALSSLRAQLDELGLELAAVKTRVVNLREQGEDFLGYHFR